MRITRVEPILLKKELRRTMRISRGGFRIRQHALVRLHTDCGLTGLGEGVGDARAVYSLLRDPFAERMLGLDPRDIQKVRADLLEGQVYFERMGSAVCAASAIEMACWDLKAQALGVPLYELLGGRFHDDLEVYASDVYWEEDPDSVASAAARIQERGVRTVKAHLGVLPPKEESVRVAALRRVLGPDAGLMIDLNAGYSWLQAREAVERWAGFDLLWLEEPLAPRDLARTAELRRLSRIPLAAGENEFRVEGFRRLLAGDEVDVAMPDIARVGGIQETLDVCVLAASAGVPVSPHNFSSGVLLAATMHVMTAVPNTFLLEFDTSENAVYQEFFPDGLDLVEGRLRVPDRPGLGISLTDEALAYRVE